MSVADVADPEVEEVAWDLDPLLDGDPSDPVAAVDAMLAEAQRARRRVRRALRRPRGRARRPRPRRGDARARRPAGDRRARRLLQRPALLDRHRRPGARRALPARAGEGDADRDEAAVLRARVGRGRRRARRRAARHRGPRLLPPPPAHGAPLPPVPALRARGEDPRREGADRPATPGAACSRSRSPRSQVDLEDGAEPVSLEVALSHLHSGRPLRARARRRARDRRARARPAHARLRLQHAAGRQDGRRPAARLPALAAEPQPRQRGVRRVGPGAGHRGPQPLRAAAPLVPPEGAAARARPAQGLRPHGRGDGREPDRPLGRGARPRAGLLLELLARARRPRPPLPRPSAGSTRRCAPASARARSAPTRCRPCTRT